MPRYITVKYSKSVRMNIGIYLLRSASSDEQTFCRRLFGFTYKAYRTAVSDLNDKMHIYLRFRVLVVSDSFQQPKDLLQWCSECIPHFELTVPWRNTLNNTKHDKFELGRRDPIALAQFSKSMIKLI